MARPATIDISSCRRHRRDMNVNLDKAPRVDGAPDVANHIQPPPRADLARADSEIARAVRHAVRRDARVSEAQIRSTVSNGWVTLEGEVGTYSQREDVV